MLVSGILSCSVRMDELPSMSLSSWGHGSSPSGRGRGRGLHHYTSLNSQDSGDEQPLMSAGGELGGGEEGEEWGSSGEEEDLLEQSQWVSRKRWQQRIRSQSGLIGWFFDGGWQLLLNK